MKTLILLDKYILRLQEIIDRMNLIMDSFPKISVPDSKDGWGTELERYLRKNEQA